MKIGDWVVRHPAHQGAEWNQYTDDPGGKHKILHIRSDGSILTTANIWNWNSNWFDIIPNVIEEEYV